MPNIASRFVLSASLASVIAVLGLSTNVVAAPLSLPDIPVLADGADPNLVLTLDDSGSMGFAYMPDDAEGGRLNKRFCSSAYNSQYYNPTVQYQLPVNATGVEYTTSFTNARNLRINPYNTTSDPAGHTVTGYVQPQFINLSTSYRPVLVDTRSGGGGQMRIYATCGETYTLDTGMPSNIQNDNEHQVPTAQRAFYYAYRPTSCTSGAAALTNDTCFYKVVIGSTTTGTGVIADPGVTFDANGDTVLDLADSEYNFAIWYSFYRSRHLAAKSIISIAFKDLPGNVRVAGHSLNAGPSAIAFGDVVGPVKRFESTDKTTFYNKLFGMRPGGTTPLRAAMTRVGEHYASAGASSPYQRFPGVGDGGGELSCRLNFHVMVTDGYWNTGNDPDSDYSLGNVDGTSDSDGFEALDGTPDVLKWPGGDSSYTAAAPYSDSNSNVLGDIAMKYWMKDLRDNLDNDVPRYIAHEMASYLDDDIANPASLLNNGTWFDHPGNDPANWQHMVNFTIAMGLEGTLNPDLYNSALKLKSDGTTSIAWPTITTDAHKLDDLFHAAVNSRGKFYPARDPAQLATAFSNALGQVAARSGAQSAGAVNSSLLNANTRFYQSNWADGWVGHLKSYTVSLAGVISATAEWDANDTGHIPAHGSRVVLTYDPSTGGVPFLWANLNSTQKNWLADEPSTAVVETTATTGDDPLTSAVENTTWADTVAQWRVDYLRGDTSREDSRFRVRGGRLGDIVNSAPAIASNENYGYLNGLEGTLAHQLYNNFVATKSTRAPVVYVGANDGMLHGFNASFNPGSNAITSDSGDEVLAYVPNLVVKNLNKLTDPSYAHRNYVDGTPTVADAYGDFGTGRCGAGPGACWRTVLVGGLNSGGRGYYALDVTNPANFNNGNAGRTVLWEFTDTDLGYSYGQPAIVRMMNGEWAAVFGSGYNNINPGNGHAILYIVFLDRGLDGAWTPTTDFIKIDTQVGNTTTPNGLTTVTPVDVDGDSKIDYIYGGDLRGNMWKFNVRSGTATNWDVAFKTSGNVPVPLFTTGTANKPITGRPDVGAHPDGVANGYMVYFGTGKLVEKTDNSTTLAANQTFYGIWDQDTGTSVVTTATPPVANTTTDLLQQTLLDTADPGLGSIFRIISNNPMTWYNGASGYKGWFMNFGTAAVDAGERIIAPPVVRGTTLLFTTVIPGGDRCEGGAGGWLMCVDAENGGRLNRSCFDVNGDNAFNAADQVDGASGGAANQNVYASGTQRGTGTGGGNTVTNVTVVAGSGNSSVVGQTWGEGDPLSIGINTGGGTGRRISWKQLK